MTYSPVAHAVTYADESDDKQRFVLACVSVPVGVVEPATTAGGRPNISSQWQSYFGEAKAWRHALRDQFGIPVAKELKGSKLATGRNSYDMGKGPIYGRRAIEAYHFALSSLEFLPNSSVFSVYTASGYNIYGNRKLEASLYAMFQRLQRQMSEYRTKIFVFFDEGHHEYRTLFRRACVHLPTGSAQGAWAGGQKSKSIPMTCTIEDANFKDSRSSWFIQIADLVAYATLVKARGEMGSLSEKEIRLGSAALHDSIPRRILNTNVVRSGDDGIVRLRRSGP
jgi:hypothetical protein